MKIQETKEKIIEVLEGKRTGQIWDLIEKSYLEVFEGVNKKDLEIAKEDYFKLETEINVELNRYLLVEHYNLNDGFYSQFFGDGVSFEGMFEDYFEEDNGGFEEVLIIDMQEKKCYLVDKEVKYPKQEIKLK